jgi:hypothetical protein
MSNSSEDEMGDIVSIGGHSRMTPTEALDVATRVEWENVIVIGCDQDENYKLHCSDMTRAQILYYLETAKLDVMQPALAVFAKQSDD